MNMRDIKWAITDAWYRWVDCPINGHRTKMDSYGICIKCNKPVPRHRA